VAKSHAHGSPERYEDVVRRLDEVVKLLESNEVPCKACSGSGAVDGRSCASCAGRGTEPLPLEESLKAFEEGVGLVRKGEAKLNEAEKRVELLLNESGDQRVPFDPERTRAEASQAPAPTQEAAAPERRSKKAAAAEEDVPF
jgi:exodeoxyribonuclease VII small subunit